MMLKNTLKNIINSIPKTSILDYLFIPSPNNRSPELGQSIARLTITLTALVLLQVIGYFSSFDDEKQILAINIIFVYFLFSLPYFYLVYRYPNSSPWRKYFIIFSDILVLSFVTSLFGVAGAAVYPIYIWIVIANGLRFGLHFLHYSSAVALSGFSIAVIMSASWMAQVELAVGLGLAMMIMPLFFLTLLKHLNNTNQLLENKIEETEYMMTHDSLTDLPNRLYLEQSLKLTMSKNRKSEQQLALFFIDVNSFKFINDTLGHLAGDQLIIQFSERLASCLRSSDILARLSGDKFMMLLNSKQAHSYASNVAERLMENANGHYDIYGHEIFVSFSVGIAQYPWDGDTAETLIKNADTALYYAKKHSKSSFRFYDKQMSREISDELRLQNELRKAFENHEFELFYQAQVDAATKNIVGAEALLRWNHPQKGLLTPDKFIDVAEKNSLIFDLGKWIIEQACADRARWNKLGIESIFLTINVSGRQFMEENFVEHIIETLEKNEIRSHQIGLEITERVLIEEMNIVQDVFKQLKRMNIKLCLDDFGTGYSSLSYLKRFPIDTIKIDSSFIKDVPYNEEACSLVKAILAIGHSLKMNTVAEGVENEAQYIALKDWGCESIQGFYFNKPMPENVFLSHLISNSSSPQIIPLDLKR